MANIINWLKDKGVKIAVALFIGLILYIVWRIVIHYLVKGFIKSGIKAREISRKSLIKTTEKISIVSDDKKIKELSEDEKIQIKLRAKTIGGVLKSIGTFIIIIIVLIQVMEAAGIPTNSLLTGAALIGLALAFAVQTIVGDFVSGIFLLLEGAYNINDIVTLNGIFGNIERMTLRITAMRGLDGTLYTIPNGDIRIIKNHSRDFNVTVCNVGITYESDLEKCIAILNEKVIKDVENDVRIKSIILEKPIIDGIGELAGSSVNIRLLVRSKAGYSALINRVCNEYIHSHLKTELAYPTTRIINKN